MGKLTLYGVKVSPPVRAVLLTLKALNLQYEFHEVKIMEREHLSKEYLEKNPQHTVPTLDDDGNYIWDSHAIIAYLVRKYAKDDSLYPIDFLKRAVVDQRLHFESSVLYAHVLLNIVLPMWVRNDTKVAQSKIDALFQAYDFLETFLKDHNYVAGDELTIADFSIVPTVTSFPGIIDIDAAKYPKVTAWIERMKKLPYYQEANGEGVEQYIAILKSKNFQIIP